MKEAILAAARSCLDTPFKHQGRIAGVGLDCAGLAVHVLNSLSLPLIDIKGYGRIPNEGALKRIMDMQPSLESIHVEESAPGDFLLIRVSREPSHIAIQSSDDGIIHAYEQVGRTCEHRMDNHWRKNVVAAYRVIE
jgi:cell wall-associated NlpC family hydrolase